MTKKPKKYKNAPTLFPLKKLKMPPKHTFWFWCSDFVFRGIFVFFRGLLVYFGRKK